MVTLRAATAAAAEAAAVGAAAVGADGGAGGAGGGSYRVLTALKMRPAKWSASFLHPQKGGIFPLGGNLR